MDFEDMHTENLLVPKVEPEDSIFIASGLCETLIEDEDLNETKPNKDARSNETQDLLQSNVILIFICLIFVRFCFYYSLGERPGFAREIKFCP